MALDYAEFNAAVQGGLKAKIVAQLDWLNLPKRADTSKLLCNNGHWKLRRDVKTARLLGILQHPVPGRL